MATDAGLRKAVSLSLDAALIEEARALGVNVSQAAEAGLAAAVRARRATAWVQSNGAAIASSNIWVAERGLPLARYRRF